MNRWVTAFFLATIIGFVFISHGAVATVDSVVVLASRLTVGIQTIVAPGSALSYTASAVEPAAQEAAVANTPPQQEPVATAQPEAANIAAILPATSPQFTIAQQGTPIVELVTAADRPVTEGELNGILNGLSNMLALIPSAVSSRGYTAATLPQAVAADGNPDAIGAGAAINQLANTNITAPAITGGSIVGASLSGGSISGATLSGTSLSAGASTLEATTITGGLALTGGALFDNASSTNLFASVASFGTLSAPAAN